MSGPLNPIESYRDALNAVFQEHGVVLAYLYGSQARGEAGPLSDVDIAVLFARDVPEEMRFRFLLRLHTYLMGVFGRDDVFVVDLEKATPLLKNNVRKDGQVLYCTDENAHLEFQVQALNEYIDTKPLRRTFRYYQNKRLESKLQALEARVKGYA